MASSSAALALKATVVATILAMLVVPSLGRCGHSRAPPPPPPPPTLTPPPPEPMPAYPAPPPPPAAPTPPPPEPMPPTPPAAPGPGPTISCNECSSQCCNDYVRLKCSGECDGIAASCNSCKTTVFDNCTADGNCTGSCDCNTAANNSCTSACSTVRSCDPCRLGLTGECADNCSKQCSAPNCIP